MTDELNRPRPLHIAPGKHWEDTGEQRDKQKDPLTQIPQPPVKRQPETHGEHSEAKTAEMQLKPAASKDKLAMWFFLGGEITLFAALIVAYTISRINYPDQYAVFRSHLSLPLVALNTVVLIVSSYFVVQALEAARHDRPGRVLSNLVVVLALGALFVGGQAYEWSTLFAEGIGVSHTFGTPFYVVTGIHGSHVLIGVAWAALLLVLGTDREYDNRNSLSIEIFGLYWHFVDIVWIVLFSLIYLL